jgi:hypothetical protein
MTPAVTFSVPALDSAMRGQMQRGSGKEASPRPAAVSRRSFLGAEVEVGLRRVVRSAPNSAEALEEQWSGS